MSRFWITPKLFKFLNVIQYGACFLFNKLWSKMRGQNPKYFWVPFLKCFYSLPNVLTYCTNILREKWAGMGHTHKKTFYHSSDEARFLQELCTGLNPVFPCMYLCVEDIVQQNSILMRETIRKPTTIMDNLRNQKIETESSEHGC